MGLYQATQSKMTIKEELDQMKSLSNDIELEREKQKQADLEEQKYYEEISKFADGLLAEDRNLINQKSKEMAMSIRQAIKDNGGDMKKFMQNGGHKLLGAYKSSIVNSSEASMYLDNKKNLERILDIQSKGLGHLINPKDLASLEDRRKNGTGPITFSGMLNEVKISDIQKEFAYGANIPPEFIVDKFYAQLAGNYSQIYGVSNPTKEQLVVYAINQFGNVKGQNVDLNKEYFDQAYKEAMHQTDIEKFNANGQYNVDVQNQSAINQANNDYARAVNDERKYALEATLKAFENQGVQGAGKGKVSDDGQTVSFENPDGTITTMTKDELENMQGDMIQTITMLDELNETHGKNGNILDISDKTGNGIANALPGTTIYKTPAYNYSNKGEGAGRGGVFYYKTIGKWLFDGFGNSYFRPTGARLIQDGNNIANYFKSAPNNAPVQFLKDEKGNLTNNVDVDALMNNNGLFDSAGISTNQWDPSVKKGTSSFMKDVKDGGNMRATGLIQGYIGKDANGNERMVMDVTDKEGNRKDSNDKEYKKNSFGRNVKSGYSAGLFVVLRNDDGDTFYQRIDDNKRIEILSGGKISGAKANTIVQKTRMRNDQAKQFTQDLFRPENGALRTSVNNEANTFLNRTSPDNAYLPLSAGFYTAFASSRGMNVADVISTNAFSVKMSEFAQQNPGVMDKIKQGVKSGKMSVYSVIEEMKKAGFMKEDPKLLEDWINHTRNFKFNR